MAVRCRSSCAGCGPALAHFVHALPLRCPVPGRAHRAGPLVRARPSVMGCWDRRDLPGRRAALGAARRARPRRSRSARSTTSSSSTASPPEKIVVTPLASRPGFVPGRARLATTCSSSARSSSARTRCRGRRGATRSGASSSSSGPPKDAELAAELARAAPTCAASSPKDELVRALPAGRGAALPVALRGLRPAGRRGDGLRDAGRRHARAGAARGRGRRRVFAEPTLADAVAPRARRPGPPRRRAGLERARAFSWEETARVTVDVYREVLAMKVSAVVISHGHAARAARTRCPRSRRRSTSCSWSRTSPAACRPRSRTGTRVLENDRAARLRRERQPRSPRRRGEFVADREPGRRPRAGRGRACSSRFIEAHPRAGVAGPQMLYSDGTLAGVAAQLPDGRRDARPAHAAAAALPAARAGSGATTCSTSRPTSPLQADTMLGAFLLLRRAMLDEIGGWDAGYRMYCEDIDLNYRAAKAGWERWYVPARGRPPRVRGRDRQALPHAAHALARARDAPLPAQASRAAARAG